MGRLPKYVTFAVVTFEVSSRIFFIDMCHRIASLLFLYLTVLLVNLRYYLRYHTLCMLQFYFLHVCGRIYCSTSLACIVFCFTSRDVRKVIFVRHFTVVVYLIVVKVTFSFFVSSHMSTYYTWGFFTSRHLECVSVHYPHHILILRLRVYSC
jgi:hypothetical protein